MVYRIRGNQIERITTAGKITEYPLSTANSQPSYIVGLVGGDMWFTEYGSNKIGRINPTAGTLDEYPVRTPNSQPYGITMGPMARCGLPRLPATSSDGLTSKWRSRRSPSIPFPPPAASHMPSPLDRTARVAVLRSPMKIREAQVRVSLRGHALEDMATERQQYISSLR